MRRILHRLRQAEALTALGLAWILVFILPFRHTVALIGQLAPPESTITGAGLAADDPVLIRARSVLARLSRLAARFPGRTTCLVRALAGLLLLRRRGIPSVIRFGVARDDPADGRRATLKAHAWLLIGPAILLGGEIEADYAPIADLGSRQSGALGNN